MKTLNKTTIGMVVAAAAIMAGCDGRSLDLTANVTDTFDTPTEPCEFAVPLKGDEDGDGDDDTEWPIAVGGKFKLVKSGEVYRIEVEGSPDNVLGKADLTVFNPTSKALRFDYCSGGGPVRKHPYAVGITEIQGHEGPQLRALVYFPMRLRYETPETSADAFYLMLMSVEEEARDCEENAKKIDKRFGEAFIGASEVRCKALQRLGVLYREPATPAKFRNAVKAEIENILPDMPIAAYGFHNGVIHGNF
jgi:hypothetical protein